jgi:hypothetical protein
MCDLDEAFELDLSGGRHARAIRAKAVSDLWRFVRNLDLGGRTALVIVGGASAMSESERREVEPTFREVLAPIAERLNAAVIDGGTNTGVMRLMGSARAAKGYRFPLIGVIVDELVSLAGASAAEGIELEPNHTHFVLVPGSAWGEEAQWLARLATVIAGTKASVTVLVNGGEIALTDAWYSINFGRDVVVIGGSGGAADTVAAAGSGGEIDGQVAMLATSEAVHVVDASEPSRLARLLIDLLQPVEVE